MLALAQTTVRARLVEFSMFGICLVLAVATTRLEPFGAAPFNLILAIGYLLLAGTVLADLLHPLGLPHLTAYITVGVLGGPHVLNLVNQASVESLVPVNTLAISLIALAGGLKLEARTLLQLSRSLFISNLIQTLVVGATSALAFVALSRYIPFATSLSSMALVGTALLWGLLATSRSPSATLAVLAETKAQGPLTRWTLAFVMSSDVVVVVLATLLLVAVRPWIVAGTELSMARLYVLGHDIIGSVALGTCLGLLLAAYLRLVGRQLLLVLLVLGFVVTDGLNYVNFDPLLAFLVTGFVVRNLSQQGEALLSAVSRMSEIVFVVFFATAGAHLDLELLRQMWPVALAFFFVRSLATILASFGATRLARDPDSIKTYAWAPLISQAGLTLALSHVIEREFPQLAAGFRSLVIATVAVNEIIGPILFKLALVRTREAAAGDAEEE